MEDFRVWAELAVTRFYDGVRFLVRRLVGIPTGEPGPAPLQPRRRSQSENSMGSSAEDVSALYRPERTHSKQKMVFPIYAQGVAWVQGVACCCSFTYMQLLSVW